MFNRIALKLFAYFAVALAAFALIGGLLFQAIFARQTVDTKKAEMLARSQALAQTLSSALGESGMGGRMSGGQAMGGYGAYVRLLSTVETDVWVLDENLSFLTAGHAMGATLRYDDLPPDAETLVQQVFAGQTPFSEGFSELLGTPTLTVGAPIYQGDTVAGALLLHDAVSGIDAAVSQGVRILMYSGAVALAVSALLAMLLSGTFARPLHRMQTAALRLSEGDYTVKTGVRQKDAIGQLAGAIDGLSDRLLVSRQEAQRQEQLRKDFLSNVSHELRTPVTVLRGSLEALCDGVVTGEAAVGEYHRQMLKETVGLQRLVNDLMDLSRLQNPDFPMERAPLNLREALGDALRSAEQLARAKDIRLERKFAGDAVPITGDYDRLRQMFLIVLDNAVKFSPMHGTVTVTLSQNHASVADEGPGIPPEEIGLVFDRFYKARGEDNRQGSGLGLAIAKQIAQRHGIRISASSEPGAGAAFHFDWPDASAAP